MRKQLFFLILIIFRLPLSAQDFGWAIQQSGNDAEGVYQIANDDAGNIYETGNFWGTVDFDPSAATFNLTSNGVIDNFICKLDASGNFVWAKKIGGTGSDAGSNICVDMAGHLYEGGKFQSTVDFDPSPATYNLISAGGDDAFIASYSGDGNMIWAAKFGSTGGDFLEGLVQQDGFLYATGYFQGTVDFDPGPGVYNLTTSGADGVFFLKLDTDGNFIWARSISGTSSVISFDLDADADGNVFAGGEFWGTCDFDPGNGAQSKTATNFSSDAFLLKLDNNGNFMWVDIFKGTSDEWLKSIDLKSNGDIGICGVFQSTIDLNPGPSAFNLVSNGNYDIFIATIHSSDGSLAWAVSFGGTFNDQLGELTIPATGNFFLTGGFAGVVDFDPGAGTHQLTGVGSTDIFYLQLDESGSFVGAYGFGSSFASSIGNSIVADNAGHITFAGGFEKTIDFDPGTPVFNLTSILGTSDCFVVQLNGCTPLQTNTSSTICFGDSIFAAGEYQTAPGEYFDYFEAANGCDSIVALSLTVLPSNTSSLEVSVCEGDSFIFEGTILHTTGIYTAQLNDANGCDSTITLTLTVHPNTSSSINASICEGDAYLFNGNDISNEGIYTADLTAGSGCDSTVILYLDVLPVTITELYETICEGEFFVFGGSEIDSAGSYSAVFTGSAGCDSSVTLHLEITEINASVIQSNDTLFATGNGTVQWILCESGLPVLSADQPVFIPAESGVYAAVFTNGNCRDTTECSYYTTIHTATKNFSVAVFPNPVKEKVTVAVNPAELIMTAEIRNVFGELLQQWVFSSTSTFDLKQLPAGIYFLYVSSEGNKIMKKLVVAPYRK
ncbi:MAG TPA: T9SS type A sorting domain-containing protein [Chitinophagales bacterium]|nr:T9SS type A sorting domain-containing protein [Chitinophagales bacterium]